MRTGKKPLRDNDLNTLSHYANLILTDQVQSITSVKKRTSSPKALAGQVLREKEKTDKIIYP